MFEDDEQTNFLNETKRILAANNARIEDIEWMGSEDGAYIVKDWAAFEKIADFNYDSGYGSAKIPQDFIIVGRYWWLTRSEYDGSEGWDFHQKPGLPQANPKPITALKGDMWQNLKRLNDPDMLHPQDDFANWKQQFSTLLNKHYMRSYTAAEKLQAYKQAKYMLDSKVKFSETEKLEAVAYAAAYKSAYESNFTLLPVSVEVSIS